MATLYCDFVIFPWILFVWFFQIPAPVIAEIVNRTIDDTFGDSQTGLQVTYLPGEPGVWKTKLDCTGCNIHPDLSKLFNETYTAATYFQDISGPINITMQFNGTAIYVFFTLANGEGPSVNTLNTLTLVSFTLDGNPPQFFEHAPDLSTSSIEYNQSVFSQTNLVNAQHTLVIAASGVNEAVYVSFDYAVYTHDDDAPLLPLAGGSISPMTTPANLTMATSPAAPEVTVTATSTAFSSASTLGHFSNKKFKSSTAGLISGGVISALTLASCLIYFHLRRRKSKKSNAVEGDAIAISPFVQATLSTTQSTGALYGMVEHIGMSGAVQEQLRSMRQQIVNLQDQQHSARVQELPDDPPPEYTPTNTSLRY